MNTRKRCLLAMTFILVLWLLPASPADAGTTRTEFTGSETWVTMLEPGKEFFPDGRYHIRGEVDEFAFEATDPRLDQATNTVTINCNFRLMPEPVYVAGEMWGKFMLANAGGYWEGTWTGSRDENGYSYFHFTGHGGGGYEGLHLQMWGERLTPDPTAPELYYGYILEPGN